MSLYKYLDDSGLRKTWELIKSYISNELTSLRYGGVNSNFSYNLAGSSGHPSGSSYFCVAKLLLSYTAYAYEELTFSYSYDYGTLRRVEGIYSFNCRFDASLNFICSSRQHTLQNSGAIVDTPTIVALKKQYSNYAEIRIYVDMGNQNVFHIKNVTYGHYTRKLLTSWTSTTKDRWWIRQSGQLSLDDSWCDGTAQSIDFGSRYADILLYMDSASLASVATSGSYTDLINTPTIDSAPSTTSTNAVQNSAITTLVNSKANDTDVVHLASSENITGAKTFIGTAPIILKSSDSSTVSFELRISGTNPYLLIRRKDGSTVTASLSINSDRVVFLSDASTNMGVVSSSSDSNSDWNTKQLPTKNAVKSLVNSKANDTDVVHLASSENITGAKTFVNTGKTIILKRSSSATTDLTLLVDTDNHPNIRRYDNSSVSQNVLLKSDRIEFRNNLTTVNAYVSSNSNLNQDWNTNQLPTKTAVKSLVDSSVSDINVDLESNLVDAEIILTSDFSDLIINFN